MPSSEAVLLRDVEIAGERSNCRTVGARIVEVGAGLVAQPGDQVVDGHGGALLPGLADHHLHLWATAAARGSLDLDGAVDLTEAARTPSGLGWLRVIGAGRLFERSELDVAWPDRPVRVQHRSGAVWMLNSTALDLLEDALDADQRASGQLWRADRRLREAISAAGGADLAGLGAELAASGITHLTDATPDLDAESIAALREAIPQHLLSLAPTGSGPAKLIVADHEPPDLDGLIGQIAALHNGDRPVAIHAVTRLSLTIVVAALAGAGVLAGDRIEHAAVCDDALAERIAELGVAVVTQPALWTRRGLDFLAESPLDERPLLWRHAGLLRLGVPVAVSSDAPYGPPDPWATIRAAATRQLRDASIGGPDERVSPAIALQSMLAEPGCPTGPARAVAPGAAADLILLHQPLAPSLASVVAGAANPVRLTIIDGVLLPHPDR